MFFQEIKPNNRLQIECESEEAVYRNIRGIVLAISDKSIIMVTDFGELMEIDEDKILSITQIQFPKIVSDSLMNLKNYYNEIYELEHRLKEMRKNEELLKSELFDANFLARFNINGAKNRLDNSIDHSLLHFKQDNLSYQISFQSNPNNQIELNIVVANHFEYYNLLDEVGDVEKIIRIHAPNVKELLEKCFPFASKAEELEKRVMHEGESMYSVRTSYRLTIEMDQDNFLEMRQKLINGLNRLRK